jgi:hypothetical protein
MPRPRLSDLSGTRLLEPAGLLPASGAEASREFDPGVGRFLDQPSIEPALSKSSSISSDDTGHSACAAAWR